MNQEIAATTVLGVGMGTVFVGLIAIILLCYLLRFVCEKLVGKTDKPRQQAAGDAPVAQASPIPNRQEFIAAVSAAIAEDLGTEASNIRIHSVTQVN